MNNCILQILDNKILLLQIFNNKKIIKNKRCPFSLEQWRHNQRLLCLLFYYGTKWERGTMELAFFILLAQGKEYLKNKFKFSSYLL
jgi:hypothetical protein